MSASQSSRGFAGLEDLLSEVEPERDRVVARAAFSRPSVISKPVDDPPPMAPPAAAPAPKKRSALMASDIGVVVGMLIFVALFVVAYLVDQPKAGSPPSAVVAAAPSAAESTTAPPSATPPRSQAPQRQSGQSSAPKVRPEGLPSKVQPSADPFNGPAPAKSMELLPPVGTNEVLSNDQIRYCVAENIRMSGWEPAVDQYSTAAVDAFNVAVADLNARCGSYRYRRGALERVRAEVEPSRIALQREGAARARRRS